MINAIVKDTFVIKPAFPGPDLCKPLSVKMYKMFVTDNDLKKYIFQTGRTSFFKTISDEFFD